MADSIIQNSLGAGELSPHLYGRTDLAKYHSGCMLARNMYVDYRGGLASRPGMQFIDLTPGNVTAHLQRFVFSSTQTYILVFTNTSLAFIRNPLTSGHINGSNAGYILSGGVPYTISTPYITADLPLLKFSQSADVMIITHPSYPPMQLIRHADTNWTLSNVIIGTTMPEPSGVSCSITGLPTGSTDPQNTNYSYGVTAVGPDGQEGQMSYPGTVTGINIAATQGTVTIQWAQAPGAVTYNVYKAVPSPGGVLVPPTASYGFIGVAYGTMFTDSNIIADFSQTPPQFTNPLNNGQVINVNITNGGSGYPVGGSVATVVDPNGATVGLIPVLNNNTGGGTGSVIGFANIDAGHDVTNGAAVTVTGGGGSGFVGTVNTTAASGAWPAVSAYFQQRRVYAGSNANPLTLNGSRTAYFNNFDVSNPPVESDAYTFTIAQLEINKINWLISMPGGLVIFTDASVVQLTGGSLGVSNPAAVTPNSAVIVPQSYYGAADSVPIVINYDILYVQSKGSIVRDLAYNFFVNIYTGTDRTQLSSHFFAPRSIIDWAYEDTPHKVIWAVRDDGIMLSLTYLKDEDIYGWAQHNTQGSLVSIESVREGSRDAIYMVVLRNGNYCVERLAGDTIAQASDAWCLDSALASVGTFLTTVGGLSHLEGMTVYALVDGVPQGPFTVSGGAITLTTGGSTIVVGLQFVPQFQQLPILPGGAVTPEGKRHRDVVTTLRVMNTGASGLQVGTSFQTLKPFRPGVSSTDTVWHTPYQPSGLVTGEIRMHMDAKFRTQSGICAQMNDPLPFTILAVIDEVEGLRP